MLRGDFRTLARLAAESGADYFALLSASTGVRPQFTLNGVGYFSPDACKRLLTMARARSPRSRAKPQAVAHG